MHLRWKKYLFLGLSSVSATARAAILESEIAEANRTSTESVIPASPWILLYDGRDRAFRPADRAQLHELLESWGIDYRLDGDGAVRVAAPEKSHVLNLLQRAWTSQNPEVAE